MMHNLEVFYQFWCMYLNKGLECSNTRSSETEKSVKTILHEMSTVVALVLHWEGQLGYLKSMTCHQPASAGM